MLRHALMASVSLAAASGHAQSPSPQEKARIDLLVMAKLQNLIGPIGMQQRVFQGQRREARLTDFGKNGDPCSLAVHSAAPLGYRAILSTKVMKNGEYLMQESKGFSYGHSGGQPGHEDYTSYQSFKNGFQASYNDVVGSPVMRYAITRTLTVQQWNGYFTVKISERAHNPLLIPTNFISGHLTCALRNR